jgi:hypothetical protein
VGFNEGVIVTAHTNVALGMQRRSATSSTLHRPGLFQKRFENLVDGIAERKIRDFVDIVTLWRITQQMQ